MSRATVDASEPTLGERIQQYCDASGLKFTDFARRCGLSVQPIYKVRDGVKVRPESLKRIEAVLNGANFEQEATSESQLDVTSEKLLKVIVDHASKHDQLMGVANFALHSFKEEVGEDAFITLTTSLVRQYLGSIGDDDQRVSKLLELYDTVKNPKS